MVDTKELPQRARYYQSVCDGVALSKGDFLHKPQGTVCYFPLPDGHFQPRVSRLPLREQGEGKSRNHLGDLTFKNYYIFTRYEEFKDPVVRAYMKYFATRNADSSEAETINSQVAFYKTGSFIRVYFYHHEKESHFPRSSAHVGNILSCGSVL